MFGGVMTKEEKLHLAAGVPHPDVCKGLIKTILKKEK